MAENQLSSTSKIKKLLRIDDSSLSMFLVGFTESLKAKLVVFKGTAASGKTTIAEALCEEKLRQGEIVAFVSPEGPSAHLHSLINKFPSTLIVLESSDKDVISDALKGMPDNSVIIIDDAGSIVQAANSNQLSMASNAKFIQVVSAYAKKKKYECFLFVSARSNPMGNTYSSSSSVSSSLSYSLSYLFNLSHQTGSDSITIKLEMAKSASYLNESTNFKMKKFVSR